MIQRFASKLTVFSLIYISKCSVQIQGETRLNYATWNPELEKNICVYCYVTNDTWEFHVPMRVSSIHDLPVEFNIYWGRYSS